MRLFRVRWHRDVSAVLLGMLVPLTQAPAAAPVNLVTLQQMDETVLTVGYRLATAADDLCADREPAIGIALHQLSQYGPAYRASAEKDFGLGDRVTVLAVAQGSPAAKAGMRAGDAIVSIDAAPVRASRSDDDGYLRIAATLSQIDAALADGQVDLVLLRAGRPFALHIRAESACRTQFRTRIDAALASAADGAIVEISTGLVGYVHGPDELAAILGHELAHNILHDTDRLDQAGVERGRRQRHGRNARLTRQTEIQADQLGVYLADRAGFDPAAAMSFWQRIEREHGAGWSGSSMHPAASERIALISAEIARIARMKAAGVEPRPAFLENGSPPALR